MPHRRKQSSCIIGIAADRLRESLLGSFALGDKQAVAASLAAWAAYALVQGDLQRAARLFGASEALQEAITTPLMGWDIKQIERNVATLRQQLNQIPPSSP
jgi:hypothetical protein